MTGGKEWYKTQLSHTFLAAWLPGMPTRWAYSEPPPGTSSPEILTQRFAQLWMFDPNGFQPLQQLR